MNLLGKLSLSAIPLDQPIIMGATAFMVLVVLAGTLAAADKDAVPALLQVLHEQGGVDGLLALLDRVETAAAEVGGVERLRDCLQALKKIAA